MRKGRLRQGLSLPPEPRSPNRGARNGATPSSGRRQVVETSRTARKVAIAGRSGYAHLPGICELDGLPTRLSSAWVRRCSSSSPMGSDLTAFVVSVNFLLCASDFVAKTYGLDHALDGIFGHVEGELAGADLGDVKHGITQTGTPAGCVNIRYPRGACRWSE